jgi:hypothetical protein
VSACGSPAWQVLGAQAGRAEIMNAYGLSAWQVLGAQSCRDCVGRRGGSLGEIRWACGAWPWQG